MSSNIHQIELRDLLSTHQETLRTGRATQKEKWYETSVALVAAEEGQEKEKLKTELAHKKPTLPLAQGKGVILSSDENKPKPPPPSDSFVQSLRGMVRILYGSLEDSVERQKEASNIIRINSEVHLEQTNETLRRQGDLLQRQKTLTQTIESQQSGALGELNAIFKWSGFIALGLGVFSMGLTWWFGGAAVAASTVVEGATEAAVAEAGADAGAADAAVGAAGAGADVGAVVNDGGALIGAAERQVGEQAAKKATQKAVQGAEEGALKKIWNFALNQLQNPKSAFYMAGSLAGSANIITTSQFQFILAEQHQKLSEDQHSFAKASSESESMKGFLAFTQKDITRQNNLTEQFVGLPASLMEAGGEYFRNRSAIARIFSTLV